MKKLLPLLLCAVTVPAFGTILVSSGFEGYAASGAVAGTTAPATGDVGIATDTWAGANWSWQATGLSYTDANGTISGGSRALDYTGSNYQFRQVNVSPSSPITQTVFVRFLAKLDAAPTGTNLSGLQFVINNNVSNNNNNYFPGFGVFAGGPSRTDGSQTNQFFAASNSSGLSNPPAPTSLFGGLAGNSVNLVVGKLTWDGSEFSSLSVWANPTSGDEATPSATIDISGLNITALSELVFRGGSTTGGPRGVMDEFAIATAWADVVVVPEPSTYAILLGLGALGFVMWRRRR